MVGFPYLAIVHQFFTVFWGIQKNQFMAYFLQIKFLERFRPDNRRPLMHWILLITGFSSGVLLTLLVIGLRNLASEKERHDRILHSHFHHQRNSELADS